MERILLNGLDLFSGYGGITLALSEWVRPLAYCEIDKYAQGILLSRMAEGKLPVAPIWNDVNTFDSTVFGEQIDIVYGGFPCQDISIAGAGKGLAGERSGLFYEVCRLVEEINPKFVFLENVPAIRTRGLREVVREFTDMGYDCRWTRVSAESVGAPHRRERWFFLAHAKGDDGRGELRDLSKTNEGQLESEEQYQNTSRESSNASKDTAILANNNGQRLPAQRTEQQTTVVTECGRPWSSEPDVGRVVDGCPFRVDRIKALGNGVVPEQAKEAFKRLIGLVDVYDEIIGDI